MTDSSKETAKVVKPAKVNILQQLKTLSDNLTRNAWANALNTSFNGKRDFNAVFGYDSTVSEEQMRQSFLRGGISGRIVKAFPDSVWSGPPTLHGSPEFLTAWQALEDKFNIWGVLHRTEILARLSPYAVILVGLSTTKPEDPAKKVNKLSDLLYLQPYGAQSGTITAWDEDSATPNYGRPKEYTFNPNANDSQATGMSFSKFAVKAHYTRTVHITQEVLENDLYGIPALLPIWNWLMDLTKVVGASAENFWLTANRGMHIDVDKELAFDANDEAALADELDEYQHQLRRTIRTRGVKITNLGAEVADPKNTANLLIQLISGSTGIPTRILMGSESGHLASTQDKGNWAERIEEYRRLVSTPRTLAPLIARLTALGLLPAGEVWAEWPDAYKQSPLERGQTSAQTARTAANLARATKDNTGLLSTEEQRRIIGLSTDGKALDDTANLEGETSQRQRVSSSLNILQKSVRVAKNEFLSPEGHQIIRVR